MFFKQLYLGSLAQASYLVGDEQTGRAAVIDPRRDVDIYLEVAEAAGLRIEHVLLTAAHGSFVAGHLELRALCDAKIWLGAGAPARYDFQTMEESGELVLGPACCLRFLATPGISPEAMAILLLDLERDEPHAVLSGDTLLVGEIGRPGASADADSSLEDGARHLHASLFDRLLSLPEATLLYPGHGSPCSAGEAPRSSVGEQATENPDLVPMSVEDFVERIVAHPAPTLANRHHLRSLNLNERALLPALLEAGAESLSLSDALRLANTGAQLLDVRDAAAHAAGHLEDSVNVDIDGRLASLAGAILPTDAPVVLIVEAGREAEATRDLARVGLEVVGYLMGGVDALKDRPDLLKTVSRVSPTELVAKLSREGAPFLLDVRSRAAWDEGRIADSACVPIQKLREHVRDLPRDRDIVLCSESGISSSSAMGILARNGFTQLADLDGGLRAWKSASLPLER